MNNGASYESSSSKGDIFISKTTFKEATKTGNLMIYKQKNSSQRSRKSFKNTPLKLFAFQAINLMIVFLLALHLPGMIYKAVPLLIIALMFDYYVISKSFQF